MNDIKVKGIIYSVFQKETISEKFSKREIIVETSDQYPQHLKIQFVNDKCNLLDSFKIGDNISVAVNLRGRLFNDRNNQMQCFNSLEGWKIELNTI